MKKKLEEIVKSNDEKNQQIFNSIMETLKNKNVENKEEMKQLILDLIQNITTSIDENKNSEENENVNVNEDEDEKMKIIKEIKKINEDNFHIMINKLDEIMKNKMNNEETQIINEINNKNQQILKKIG